MADISRALGLLREGLGPFVEREVHRLATRNQIEDFINSNSHSNPKLRKTRVREWEVAVLLNLMQRLWGDVFAHALEPTERGFVNELRGWRNKWAHQEPLTPADVDRALDTTVRLLRAVGAETQAAAVARLRGVAGVAQSRHAPTKRTLGPSSGAAPRSSVSVYRPPSRSAPVSQADEIRRYALEHYVTPWRE